jgi:arginyl-tRNA--protein-N-Asp/Glu arginylyltransferase
MNYLHWNETTITDFSGKNIADMYDRGYVFTRIGKGVMHQTRSVRIDLAKFELSSENRRVLKKVGAGGAGKIGQADGQENVRFMSLQSTIVPMESYDWSLGKLAKDFYEEKFGPNIMSATKVKEMLTDSTKNNFNALLVYSKASYGPGTAVELGYAICYSNKEIIHYSYPFYHIDQSPKDMGLGMMTMAISFAKEQGLKYIYLGSLQRPGDTYKLQFEGLEWFDGGPEGSGKWRTNSEAVKKILASASM